jgi:dTDP-glucose 4,6-dehydratase
VKRLLVTGGAGFIGSNFVRRHIAAHPEDRVVVLDRLTYAGNVANFAGLERHRAFRFVHGDIADRDDVEIAFAACGGPIDALVHLAAESHVDRSIEDAAPFIRTNVLGTQMLLEAAQRHGVGRFLCASTDEVYGSCGEGRRGFDERAPIEPSSPYAASKAGGECLARAFHRTHDVPVIISRATNNYGPRQFPEKLIPLFVTNALAGLPLPLYGDGLNVRDWLHVDDHCDALEALLERGRVGEVYNIAGGCERRNIDIAHWICDALGVPTSEIRYVTDRRGHDRRYALDASKVAREVDFLPGAPIEERLADVVRWYDENREWWSGIKSGEYRHYYERTWRQKLVAAAAL